MRDPEELFFNRVRGVRLMRTAKGFLQAYSYHGPAYFTSLRGAADDDPVVMSLAPSQGVRFPPLTLKNVPVSSAGKTVVLFTVQLTLAGTLISKRCLGVLPPMLRLPEEDRTKSFHLALIPEERLPEPSGVFARRVWDEIMATATAADSDALLIAVDPLLLTEHDMENGDLLHSCTGLAVSLFFGPGRRHVLDLVRRSDWTDANDIAPMGKPQSWLAGSIVERCRVDSTAAYLIARTADARPRKALGDTRMQRGGAIASQKNRRRRGREKLGCRVPRRQLQRRSRG